MQKENGVIQQDLTLTIEEADISIIPYVNLAIKEKSNNIVILAIDADIVVLVLHFMEKCVKEGFQKLWIRYGTRDHNRSLPIHIMHEKLGADLYFVLLKIHILTGGYMTNGNKRKSNKSKARYGLDAVGLIDETNFLQQSEECLAQVFSSTTLCKTFDELRFEN